MVGITARIGLFLGLSATIAACGGDVTTNVNGRGVPGADGAVTDGSTDGAVTPTDGAATDDASTPPDDAGWQPPSTVDTTCVSGTRWTRGNRGSASMNPGQPCVSCHDSMAADPAEAPSLLGGTAYYLANEVDSCYGYTGTVPGGTGGAAYVEIVDATGRMLRMRINTAGNFYTLATVTFPLRSARVVGPSGAVNAMSSEVPDGDCNSCHTETGKTTIPGGDPAPGRITVPL